MNYANTIDADLYRWEAKITKKIFLKCFFIPQFRFIYFKRKCEQYRKKFKILFLIYRLIYGHYQIKYNMQIPAKISIGEGFKIGHIGGIVINQFTVIGKNVDILNGVLIGAEFRGKREGVPTIGDYVWIGANSVLVGKIKIGNNVLIAPGSFVNFDVPNNSIVMGNPGKIISNNNATYKYIKNAFNAQ